MNFEEALEYLLRLGHETLTLKFGLENTTTLLEALGQPHRRFPKVQIAGTNGKGSTAIMLESICRAASIKTGTYTSPHLQKITERIRIDSNDISEDAFARLTTQVSQTAAQLVEQHKLETLPTFFEHVTAIALLAFAESRVELAILETGLGGRLDATTAAEADFVAITPISIDHQEYLGASIEEIASEKAAIIRANSNPILAPQSPAVMDVLMRQCERLGAGPVQARDSHTVIDTDRFGRFRVTFQTPHDVYENVRLSLPGRHQVINASVAIAIAESLMSSGFAITRDAMIDGLQTAKHPGRLEWISGSPTFLLDGAHNLAGANSLRRYLDDFVTSPITLVFGAMRDKDLSEIAKTIFPVANQVVLTEVGNVRSVNRETLTQLGRNELEEAHFLVTDSVDEALQTAANLTPTGGIICITGSLYLVGEARTIIQRKYSSARVATKELRAHSPR